MKRRIYKSINVYIIFIHFLIKKKLYHEYSTKQQNYPLRDTIYHSNSHENLWTAESFDVPKNKIHNHRFPSRNPTCDLFPVTISKNLCSPSSLIAISNFKKEKMIHFAQIPSPQCESYDEPRKTIPSSTEQSTNQPLDSQNSQKHRPKSGSGSFEAEWKAIGSCRSSERDTISATNPQPANERPTPLVPGYESDINRGQALQDCSNSFRPVINL